LKIQENIQRSVNSLLSFLVSMLLLSVLSGCGQKGPLQRPAQTSSEFIAIYSSTDKPVAQLP
jgi:hypothetical protein